MQSVLKEAQNICRMHQNTACLCMLASVCVFFEAIRWRMSAVSWKQKAGSVEAGAEGRKSILVNVCHTVSMMN